MKKVARYSLFTIVLILAVTMLFTSCMKKEDYYTKDDVSGFINQLTEEINALELEYNSKVAELEAQVKALLERHEHTFGDWVNFSENSQVYCEERLFYRICTECRVLEWKQGSYEDHLFSTETIDPTCVSTGYDKHTCTTCGKTYTDNETPIAGHTWSDNYSHNGSFHWLDCVYCDAINFYGEHTADISGYCTVCDQPAAPSEGIIYEVSAGGTYAEVIGFEGDATRIIIADEYLGVPVTHIYDAAFKGSSITSIIIPDSVTSISYEAFSGCKSLTSVTIGNGVTSIGEWAFNDCSALKDVYITDIEAWLKISFGSSARPSGTLHIIDEKGNEITDITIPDSITSIGDDAFRGCSALTSITIPDSVTSIGSAAFIGCSALTSITIGNGVTSIGSNAFSWCTSLRSITIPDNVTSIGSFAFAACSVLKDVYITDIEAWLNISFGDNYDSHPNRSGTLHIIDENGNEVTQIVIPDGITEICDCAFRGCKSLTSITIPDSVTSIGSSAFENCKSLTSIAIPDSVTEIGNYAFDNCSALESIIIGDSVTSIGRYAFSNCKSLTSITISDGVTSIGDGAFSGCLALTSITIPDSVTSIGDYAFYNCSSLASVTMGNGVTSIGSRAFDGCTSLTRITIPNSITSISNYAFYGCSDITDVYYTGTEEEWTAITIGSANYYLTGATIHYNYTPEE